MFVGNGIFGETAVNIVAGEGGMLAQVFLVSCAVTTGPVGSAQPGHADPLPSLEALCSRAAPDDSPDNLVPEHQR